MDLTPVIRKRKQQILEIAGNFGASNIRLFGSAVRGDARPDSDIDLLVDFEPDRSLLDFIGFSLAVSDLLERPVDVVTRGMLQDFVKDAILSEAIDL